MGEEHTKGVPCAQMSACEAIAPRLLASWRYFRSKHVPKLHIKSYLRAQTCARARRSLRGCWPLGASIRASI